MADEAASPDFIALAQAGTALKTCDRRAVTLIAVDAPTGIIRGSIAMEGELAWRRDGSFTGAPLGVAGPLDLAPPPTKQDGPAQQDGSTKQDEPRRASLQDALNEGLSKDRAPFCCD